MTAVAALALLPAPAAAQPRDVLPDLDQVVPSGVQVTAATVGGRRVFRLGFASASANVGPGPLSLHGHRSNRRRTTMAVDQFVKRVDAGPRVVRDVGTMSYVVHPDHKHWHLLGFERYALRRVSGIGLVVLADRKTGFCLGDRYAIPQAPSLPDFDPVPQQGDTCGLGRPDILGLFVGISTGYADRYEPQIEGQFIDITGAPAGRYVLVHTVNAGNRLLESDYSNNASAVLLSLRWPNDKQRLPRVEVLKRCPASAACQN